MEYPSNPNPSKAPSFLHEFDSRIMPGRQWEPGMTISRRNIKPATLNGRTTQYPSNPDFPRTGVMRPC